ncbi:MAG: hypothetical protein ACT4NT_03375 [Nitrososphaerota archaeon]
MLTASFWVFNLGEKFFPVTKQEISSVEFQMGKQQVIEDTPMPEASADSTQAQIQIPKQHKEPIRPAINREETRLDELEKKEFSLELHGTARLATTSISKDAALTVKLSPVLGTNLQSFEIVDARLLLDSSAVSIKSISATIHGRDVVMTFVSENVASFEIKATLDESILVDKNNKQNVVLQDQLFYLIKKETPYRLDMGGTLSS